MLLRSTNRSFMVLACVLTMSQLLLAAPPVIGVAMAKGNFRVNESPVVGNANLFEGTVVETGKASSSIRIEKGAQVSLASDSRGRVYVDRLVLERGTSELGTANGYKVEALGLRIETTTPGSSARVALQDGGKLVQVAALSGPVRVLSSEGFLVGNVAAGHSLEFEPQSAGAAAPSAMSGCLVKTDGDFFLTENTSGVKIQLLGSNLDREAGNTVEVVGTTVANQQVQVNKIHRLSRGCDAAAAGAAGSGSSGAGSAAKAGAVKAAGLSVTAKAVIAGVAVAAAAGGGVAAYHATQDSSTSSSR
jgi:hypothetical protein